MHQNLQYIRFRMGNETVFIKINHISAIASGEHGEAQIFTVDGHKFAITRESWEALLAAHVNDLIIWSG
jgi:hypothetical protein